MPPVRSKSRTLHVLLGPSLLSILAAVAVIGGIAVTVVIGIPGGPQLTTGWTTAIFGLLALGGALLSAAAAASSAATSRRTYAQQLFELARSAHVDLTTGEVANALNRTGLLARHRVALRNNAIAEAGRIRDLIGEIYCGVGETAEQRMDQAMQDWFLLLWAFERAKAVRVVLEESE